MRGYLAGYEANQDVPIDVAMRIFHRDPMVATRHRVWYSAHCYEHDLLDAAFTARADVLLDEMDAAAKVGPGKLVLDSQMKIPDYTKHEIHQQPGGYVGHPFAGHIYHYATNQFYRGANDQDQRHRSYAADCRVPADGKVKRILDLGCGIGQLAVALKERFPEADVTGIDVAAPMLRYAHMRAVDLGADVNFVQRLAEDTKFPDGHFDVVASYILFHEVTADATRQILAEVARVLRPGGIFYPLDFNHRVKPSPGRLYGGYQDHIFNNEVWRQEYAGLDFAGEMKKAGFELHDESEFGMTFGKPIGTKHA